MTIPLLLVQRAKNLLLFGPLDVELDAIVMEEWDQQRDRLCREYDLFTKVTVLPAIAQQSIYSVPIGTTRIFSVLFNNKTLGYTDRINLDLMNADWENTDANVPRFWSYNALAGDVNAPAAVVPITPREFILYPAPDGAQAHSTSITLITQYEQAVVPKWLEPALLYLTVSKIAIENPNLVQPEKAKWFDTLADLWMSTAQKLMQV